MTSCTRRPWPTSTINLQSFVRASAVAILILTEAEVSCYKHNDEYGPLYQKLNRLQGPRYSSTDDLIEAKPTRSACLTSDDLDCPEFKDTDDLLVPTTRSRSLTDDEMRHRMWSSSPKIKMNKGPDVYESSGSVPTSEKEGVEEEGEETTPCSSDDEDCLTFSGADELFFPTSSDATVASAVETTPTSLATPTSHMTITSSQKFSESENPLALAVSTLVDEKFWRSSSPRIYNPLKSTNSSFVHYRNPSDFNRINFSNQQLHNNLYNNNDNNNNNYYYSSNVGRSLEKLTINIGLILGIAFGIAVLLLVLAFALFKYRNQFGSGAVGEKLVDYQASKCAPLVFEPCKVQAQNVGSHNLQPLKVDVSLNLSHQHHQQQHQQQQQQQGTPRKKDIKEWYV